MPLPWYPGHMQKARRHLAEHLKRVDVVVEVLDARTPRASRNPELELLVAARPRVVALNKADLADPQATQRWVRALESGAEPVAGGRGRVRAVPLETLAGRGFNPLLKACRELAATRPGRRFGPVGLMIVGIPNVGKSSILNRIGRIQGGMQGKAAQARVGARPGVTRGAQWIQVSEDLRLLDIPGILWPRIDDPDAVDKLGMIGSLPDESLDLPALAGKLLRHLAAQAPAALVERYGLRIGSDSGALEVGLERVAVAKGCLAAEGRPDLQRAAAMVLKDFRTGKLGRITLELP